MSHIYRVLDRIFGKAEEINGAGRCATYLYRWTVAKGRGWRLYLHRFVGDDWSRDLHDHPKRFISAGLWGSYLEETMEGLRKFTAPWIRSFPAEHRHRLTTPWGECWTLVLVLKPVRTWGFWPKGRFQPWYEYVEPGNEAADLGRACD